MDFHLRIPHNNSTKYANQQFSQLKTQIFDKSIEVDKSNLGEIVSKGEIFWVNLGEVFVFWEVETLTRSGLRNADWT